MKNPILLLWLVLLITNHLLAQSGYGDLKTQLLVRDLERESRPFRDASTGPKVMGDPYYSRSWSKGIVTLYREDKTFNLPGIKYDIVNFGVDVQLTNDIKSLDGTIIKKFEYTDSITLLPLHFVNGKDFERDGVPIRGFLRVLCSGKVNLYSLTETTVLKPNYNTALVAGNENFQIVKDRSLLFGTDKALRAASKKEVVKAWKDKEDEMKKFQKVNKLNPSRERDMILMLDYYNSL